MAVEFSEKTEAEFQEVLTRYPDTLAALLPTLFLAQREFGWISVEVMDYVAARLDVPRTKVLNTATFYTMFNKQPVGKCHIQVCTTLSCALRGGYKILDYLEDSLGIRVGETSADGGYTLSEVECLASCGTAPMFQATYSDGEIEYFENLSEKKVDEVLAELNKKITGLPDPRKMH